MCCRINPARTAAHHGDADVGELISKLARRFHAVIRRLPRADHRHGIFVFGCERAFHVENHRRVVDFAERCGISFVGLDDDLATKVRQPFHFA